MLFVWIDTLIFLVASKPSSWLSNSNIVLWTWIQINNIINDRSILKKSANFHNMYQVGVPRCRLRFPTQSWSTRWNRSRPWRWWKAHAPLPSQTAPSPSGYPRLRLWFWYWGLKEDIYRWTSGLALIRKREWKCILCDEQLRAQAGSFLGMEFAT